MKQNDVVDAFKPDFSRKHGCAWFVWGSESTVRQPEKTGGWASIGGDPAFYFSSPDELSKDVIWWTNLSKPEAWSLGRWSHIKHSGFLGPQWLTLISEWGFPAELDMLKISCAAWAEVLARLGNLLSRWNARYVDKTKKDNTVSWEWGDGDFSDALAERLNLNTDRSQSHPVLETAFCDVIENELPVSSLVGKRKVTMSLPRVEHARKILGTRYPVGDFTEVPLAEWSADIERRWDWLNKQTLPVLVRFEDIQYRVGMERKAQLWWGLRGRRFAGSMMEPVWLTAEEALEMHEHTETYPTAALRAKGWTRMNDIEEWPNVPSNFAYNNSIVAGLMQEALWRAAATPVRTPTKRIKSGVSPRAIWWRSADRRACFQVAWIFQEKGFYIHSYGEGVVTLVFDPKTVLNVDWVHSIEHSQVRVPKALAHHMPITKELTSGNVDVWLKSTQEIDAWLKVDRLLWPWIGSQTKILKDMLELSLRTLASIPAPASLSPEERKEWSSQWKNELMQSSRNAVKEAVKVS